MGGGGRESRKFVRNYLEGVYEGVQKDTSTEVQSGGRVIKLALNILYMNES